jgi:formate dehydrogenase iron-sulfur subunit
MHCGEAACVDACPTKALKKQADGRVTVEPDLCNGCGYCSQFCPFGIPKLEVTGGVIMGKGKASKCTFCQDRTDNGLSPSCVKTCPAKALYWGDRDQMIAAGKKRVETLKTRGIAAANFYGESAVGGLGRLYVLIDKPESYGLPANPQYPAIAMMWQNVIQPMGKIAIGGTLLGTFVAWLIIRRNIKMEEVE